MSVKLLLRVVLHTLSVRDEGFLPVLEKVLLTMLCQTMAQAKATIRVVTLSDNSVRRRTDEMSEDVSENQHIISCSCESLVLATILRVNST